MSGARLLVAALVLAGCATSPGGRDRRANPAFDGVVRAWEDGVAKPILTPKRGSMTDAGKIRVAVEPDGFVNWSKRADLDPDELRERAVAALSATGRYAIVRLRPDEPMDADALMARGIFYRVRGLIGYRTGGQTAELELSEIVSNSQNDTDLVMADITHLRVERDLP